MGTGMKAGKLEPGKAGRTRGVGVGGENKCSVKPARITYEQKEGKAHHTLAHKHFTLITCQDACLHTSQ